MGPSPVGEIETGSMRPSRDAVSSSVDARMGLTRDSSGTGLALCPDTVTLGTGAHRAEDRVCQLLPLEVYDP